MNAGDKVRLLETRYKGQIGTVRKVTKSGMVKVSGIHDRLIRVPPHWLKLVSEEPARDDASDFDQGFGIGGLGRHIEAPIIPTVEAIARVEEMEQRAQTCRKCGQNDVFDGAMFTTAQDSGLCDDCYE
jgi:hypothetical protein